MTFLRNIILNFVLPLENLFSHVFRFNNDRVERFFIQVNNNLVLRNIKTKPEKILLLMPHCLQFSECEYRVTGKEIRCKMCGKCGISDLMSISRQYGVGLSVATGGTMARNIIKKVKPDLIIATACERDLISGLRDTTSLPVIGILNERPFGPCVDTKVNLEKVIETISYFKGMKNEKN